MNPLGANPIRSRHDDEETVTVIPVPIAVTAAIPAIVVSNAVVESVTVVISVVISTMVERVGLGGSC